MKLRSSPTWRPENSRYVSSCASYGLDFEDDLVLNQDVEAMPGVDEESVVADELRLLPLDMETASSQLEAQARFVSRLKEPWSEGTVDLDC